jgi:hypothetical protein
LAAATIPEGIYTSGVLGPSPYALPAPGFRFRALAQVAGRAPLGGPRETAIATLVAARLAAATLHAPGISTAQRTARADAARSWIGTVALGPVPKVALTRLVETTAQGDRNAVAAALSKVTDVTAPYLDKAARSELDSLAAALRT